MTADEKLDQILEAVSDIVAWQSGHAEAAKARDRDISELRDSVYGNGVNGIKSRLQTLSERCDSLMCPSPLRRAMLKVFENVLSGAVLAMIGWLLFVYKQH